MRAAPAVSVVLGAAGLLVGAALFFGGGASDQRVFPVGSAALVLTAAAASLVLAGLVARPVIGGAGAAFLLLFGGFVVWSGISVRWSIAPDASWDYFNRDLVYFAFAVLGVLVAALVSRTLIAGVLSVLLGLVVGWALLGKVVPRLFPDGAREARLRNPIGYWNGLALLCAIAVVLGLWLASTRGFRPAARAGGVLLVYGALVAAVLTYSRAGVAVCFVVVAAWIVLAGSALDSLVAVVLAVPAALGVAAYGISLPGIADNGQAYATRVHDGRLFGVVLVAVGVGVFGLSLAAAGRPAPSEHIDRAVGRGAAIVAGVAVVALVAVVFARAGGPGAWARSQWDAFRTQDALSNTSGRFTSAGSNNRWDWWQEAWRAFRDEPAVGKGAGTFELVNRIERQRDIAVTEPHNLPLQFLADTGIVGFLLAAGALVAAFTAAVATVRRLDGMERGAALALALAVVAFCLHSLVDFDWDFVAVTAPVLFALGALVPAGAAAPVRRPVWAIGVAAFALVAVSSLFSPWLANRRVDNAYAAIGRGAFGTAAGDAADAHQLNPLSIDPLLAWGLAEWYLNDPGEALHRYRQAVDVQPDNPDAWYALGAFQLRGLHRPRSALVSLSHSRELDPFGGVDLDTLIAEAQRQARPARS